MFGFERHRGRHAMGHGRMFAHFGFGGSGPRDGDMRWGGPGGFMGGGGFGGRRAKRFDGEELRLMVLGLIGEEPQHGYQLIRAFADRSGEAYKPSPGVLYPLLTMLAEMGLIAEVEGVEGGKRRYALTPEGEAELAQKRESIDALLARLAALGQMEGRPDRAPVHRAVHNLRHAIMERLGRDGASQDLGFEIAALIDEATQKIERL